MKLYFQKWKGIMSKELKEQEAEESFTKGENRPENTRGKYDNINRK